MKASFFLMSLYTAIFTITTPATADSSGRLDDFVGKATVPRLNTTILMNANSPENKAFRDFLQTPPSNPKSLSGKRIAVLSTDGVEEIELLGPIQTLKERGAKVDLIAPRWKSLPERYGVQYPEQRATHILTVRFFEIGSWVKIDRFLDEAKPEDYDAVLVPGGAWNPDSLRMDALALRFVKAIYQAGKPTAAICHGPLVFVNAGIMKGRKATAYWNVQLDLKNAGAQVSDEAVVVDGNMITSRYPYDIPQFVTAIENSLKN